MDLRVHMQSVVSAGYRLRRRLVGRVGPIANPDAESGKEGEKIMATLAMPICDLRPAVIDARAVAGAVVSNSQARVASVAVALQILGKTFNLRRKFSRLVARQASMIGSLQDKDFTGVSDLDIKDLAVRIESLVGDERALLEDVNKLGSEIRVWWGHYPLMLAQQADHLELIADSLHAASDDEAATLLAMAVDQLIA